MYLQSFWIRSLCNSPIRNSTGHGPDRKINSDPGFKKDGRESNDVIGPKATDPTKVIFEFQISFGNWQRSTVIASSFDSLSTVT